MYAQKMIKGKISKGHPIYSGTPHYPYYSHKNLLKYGNGMGPAYGKGVPTIGGNIVKPYTVCPKTQPQCFVNLKAAPNRTSIELSPPRGPKPAVFFLFLQEVATKKQQPFTTGKESNDFGRKKRRGEKNHTKSI